MKRFSLRHSWSLSLLLVGAASVLPGLAWARGRYVSLRAPTTPGPVGGQVVSRWLAPFVRELVEGTSEPCEDCCVRPGRATYRWYEQTGAVAFDLTGDTLSFSRGYVTEYRGSVTLHGLLPHWEMPTPPRKGLEGTVQASPTGHVFVHAYARDSTHLGIDIYRDGRLTATLGPYPYDRTSASAMLIEPDGSVGVMLFGARDRSEAVAYGQDGAFQITASTTSHEIHSSPSGRRAVFVGAGLLTIADTTGTSVDVIAERQKFLLWSRDEKMLLVVRGDGDSQQIVGIDVASGQARWWVPVAGQLHWDSAAARLDDLILVVSQETRDGMHAYRLLALEPTTGRQVATWGTYSWTGQYRGDARFIITDDEVFYLDDRYFSRIDREDIRAGNYGWQLEGP